MTILALSSSLLASPGFEEGCSFVISLAVVGGVSIELLNLLGIPESSDEAMNGRSEMCLLLTALLAVKIKGAIVNGCALALSLLATRCHLSLNSP